MNEEREALARALARARPGEVFLVRCASDEARRSAMDGELARLALDPIALPLGAQATDALEAAQHHALVHLLAPADEAGRAFWLAANRARNRLHSAPARFVLWIDPGLYAEAAELAPDLFHTAHTGWSVSAATPVDGEAPPPALVAKARSLYRSALSTFELPFGMGKRPVSRARWSVPRQMLVGRPGAAMATRLMPALRALRENPGLSFGATARGGMSWLLEEFALRLAREGRYIPLLVDGRRLSLRFWQQGPKERWASICAAMRPVSRELAGPEPRAWDWVIFDGVPTTDHLNDVRMAFVGVRTALGCLIPNTLYPEGLLMPLDASAIERLARQAGASSAVASALRDFACTPELIDTLFDVPHGLGPEETLLAVATCIETGRIPTSLFGLWRDAVEPMSPSDRNTLDLLATSLMDQFVFNYVASAPRPEVRWEEVPKACLFRAQEESVVRFNWLPAVAATMSRAADPSRSALEAEGFWSNPWHVTDSIPLAYLDFMLEFAPIRLQRLLLRLVSVEHERDDGNDWRTGVRLPHAELSLLLQRLLRTRRDLPTSAIRTLRDGLCRRVARAELGQIYNSETRSPGTGNFVALATLITVLQHLDTLDHEVNQRPWVAATDTLEVRSFLLTRGEYADSGAPLPAPPLGLRGHANDPVLGLSLDEALAFCAWRTAQGEPCRLPTRAEWAVVTRDTGWTATAHNHNHARPDSPLLSHPCPLPVGVYPPVHLLGGPVYDLCGNAAIWARDADGRAWACGVSWADPLDPGWATRARRVRGGAGRPTLGVRLVRDRS